MSDLQKVLNGLEKMANAEGYRLEVLPMRHDQSGEWVMVVRAGRAQVWCRIETFAKHPQVMLEPFGEELIKQLKGQL